MVVHRDYRLTSDSIIKIFDNKIEFYNPGRLPDTISIQDLLSNTYRSTPRNKLLADVFKDLGLIEKYGSGIQRIINYFKEEQLPTPEFQNISDGFMVTVYSGSSPRLGDKLGDKLGGQETTQETTQENAERILALIRENPNISRKKMAQVLGNISEDGVKYHLAKLQKEAVISRVGSTKGGYWEILHDPS